MNSFHRAAAALAAVTALSSGAAFAGFAPTFESFGSFDEATFGSPTDSIPTDAVAVTTFVDDGHEFTLALSATERYSEPPVGNNGAGVFSAAAGGYPGDSDLARWNFNFYIDSDGANFDDYLIELLYDFDPGAGTDEADHGVINFSAGGVPDGVFLVENSWNLGFGFLGTAAPGLTPPTFAPFNPNTNGEYTFALRVFSLPSAPIGDSAVAAGPLGQVAIVVNSVPEPASAALWGLGALGLIRLRRKRRMRR